MRGPCTPPILNLRLLSLGLLRWSTDMTRSGKQSKVFSIMVLQIDGNRYNCERETEGGME